MTFRDLETRVVAGMTQPLPGLEAQLTMSPRPRTGWKEGVIPPDVRQAGVLLLVYPRGDEPTVLLTLRASRLPRHAGQVSFPGGTVEPSESPQQAALREAGEEAGLDPGAVRVVGELTPLHVPVSRYVLLPFVALAGRAPELRADRREVERILEVPVAQLIDPARQRIVTRERDARRYDVPFFDVAGQRVWGATAMVLAEFLSLAGFAPDPTFPG